MMSSNPTSCPGWSETIRTPYPPNSCTVPGSPQPQGLINLGNQAQGGQLPFITDPGILATHQLGQGNMQVINSAIGKAAIKFKEEAKALGAIQVVIGIMHIGFGIILGLLSYSTEKYLGFASIAFLGGYPFWGGLCFIISGSLAISASKEFSPCLLKSSLGMNIVSSIFAIIGVILLLVDMSINGIYLQNYGSVLSGKGISAMLIIFSLLEFCVTCTTAHFSSQTITMSNKPVTVIPTVYTVNPVTPESSSAPSRTNGYPAYTTNY